MGNLDGEGRTRLVVALFVGQSPVFYGKSKRFQHTLHSVGEDGGQQTFMFLAVAFSANRTRMGQIIPASSPPCECA